MFDTALCFHYRNQVTFSRRNVGVEVDAMRRRSLIGVLGGAVGEEAEISSHHSKLKKKLQHKPAHRRGKWFSRRVLPGEQAVLGWISCPSHQNNHFKKKNINKAVTVTLWSQQVLNQHDRPPTPSSDSECQAGHAWSQTSGLQRPGGENTEGPVFLSFGPARPGLAWTGPAGPGLLQLGTFSKSLTQSNITGLSWPGPEGLAPAHCLCNHWEFPHAPNLIFSLFSYWCFFFLFGKYDFCLGSPFNYSSVSHSFSIRHPRLSFP